MKTMKISSNLVGFVALLVLIAVFVGIIVYGVRANAKQYLNTTLPIIDKAFKGEKISFQEMEQLLRPKFVCKVTIDDAVANWRDHNPNDRITDICPLEKSVAILKAMKCGLDGPPEVIQKEPWLLAPALYAPN